MTLRWVEDDEPVTDIPANRQWFFRQVERAINDLDPEALARVRPEISAWLDDVAARVTDHASVKQNACKDWNPYERQVIFNATENWDFSRWWCGLLLMKLAIEHPTPFMAYRPGDPDSEIAIAYFLDSRSL